MDIIPQSTDVPDLGVIMSKDCSFDSHISSLSRKCKNPASGLYSGGLTWSIVLRCDDHTGIFTCDGCARDPYFYVPTDTRTELQW